ncbi:MAG TPA: hypothetical protein DEV85_02860 [Vibrio sp.]|nr:hypothetical protein [Vibrio sp.]
MQLSGAKEGRRWAINGQYFFTPINDSWALRYGGLYDGKLTLEIVNKVESSTSEVLQTINVREADFYKGLVIRNILVKGVSIDEYGIIKFKVLDMLEQT